MKKHMIAAAGLVVAASWAALAAAQPAPPDGRQPRGGLAFERQLGLSDEQAEQLRRLRTEERKQAIRRHADLAIAHMELAEALDAPTVDEKLIATRVRAVSDLQAAEVRAQADSRLALRKVLTPEQQQKLRQLTRERRQERGAAWRGRGAGRRGAPEGVRPEGPGGPRAEAGESPVEPGR
jgi:Spy/CpxP family protein refolding chaperone